MRVRARRPVLPSDDEIEELVVAFLTARGSPATVVGIADELHIETRELDRVLWGRPDRFVWQPGHRWSVLTARRSHQADAGRSSTDVRAEPLVPHRPRDLRAVTMASGLTLKVNRRPLDSDAMFAVRSVGNLVELTINSTHEIFGSLPMPFDEAAQGDFKALVELLIESWALYEDGMSGPARRGAEDTRLLWGRRAIEILRDGE